jgi:hypothetical protein
VVIRQWHMTYHFSATMPFAVRPRIYSLPFPTRPKLADEATAMRESKKGEYLTLYPLKPWVRNSSMVALCFRGNRYIQSGSHTMSREESKAEGASFPMERRSCWACPHGCVHGRGWIPMVGQSPSTEHLHVQPDAPALGRSRSCTATNAS